MSILHSDATTLCFSSSFFYYIPISLFFLKFRVSPVKTKKTITTFSLSLSNRFLSLRYLSRFLLLLIQDLKSGKAKKQKKKHLSHRLCVCVCACMRDVQRGFRVLCCFCFCFFKNFNILFGLISQFDKGALETGATFQTGTPSPFQLATPSFLISWLVCCLFLMMSACVVSFQANKKEKKNNW